MRTVGLFEAKQKLSELVAAAAEGERIGITSHGVLKVVLTPAAAQPQMPLEEVFRRMRGRLRLPRGMTTKDLIAEGRKR